MRSLRNLKNRANGVGKILRQELRNKLVNVKYTDTNLLLMRLKSKKKHIVVIHVY